MHVHVNARRWFERTNGNTYHTVSLTLTDHEGWAVEPGETTTLGPSPRTYGYGTHYLHTAGEMLAEAGLIPCDETPSRTGYDFGSWRWREEHGITLTEDVADVTRQKDLHRG